MYRTVVDLITESVEAGYEQGINRFVESIETDLIKESVFETYGVNSILYTLCEDAGLEVDNNDTDDLDEDKLDQLLSTITDKLNSDD